MTQVNVKFRDLDEEVAGPLHQLGYEVWVVSVFDHFLTDTEIRAKVMNFNSAIASGDWEEYMAGEAAFLGLYEKLSAGGVSINVDLMGGEGRLHDRFDSEVRACFRESLREVEFIDAYFEGYALRVIGGWDRTDQFLLEASAPRRELERLIAEAGLFIIDRPVSENTP